MAKKEARPEVEKKKIELKKFKLKDDYPPKKKGEYVMLSKGGEILLKSKNLI
ncbi:MAG: hypothetical protein AAF039_12820 [Bacteroidota bacterium]